MRHLSGFALLCGLIGFGLACACPDHDTLQSQQRMSLAEYSEKRQASTGVSRPAPIVILPIGTLISLRVPAPKEDVTDAPIWEAGGTRLTAVRARVESPFEGVGDVTLKLRVRETVHLDLEGFRVSRDGKKWSQLGSYFLPVLGATTEVTVTPPSNKTVTFPAWAFTEVSVMPPASAKERN